MNNKADVIVKINEIIDGGVSPASKVREVLYDDANSLAESFYSDSVTDSNLLETYTTSVPGLEYTATFFKNGNTTTVNGEITILINNSNLTSVFRINETSLQGEGIGFAISSSGNIVSILVSGAVSGVPDALYLEGSVLAGEVYKYSVTYNSAN